MKSFLSFFAFLVLLLFASTIAEGRKDVGEYWRSVMKDEQMPEAIKKLVSSSSNEKYNSQDAAINFEKIIVEGFESRPNEGGNKKSSYSTYHKFRPKAWVYGDDANLKVEESSASVDGFKNKPNIWAYGDDANLKAEESPAMVDDLKTKPNIWAYGDDAKLDSEKSSTVVNDLKMRPNFWMYGDDANLKAKKLSAFTDDFESKPIFWKYGGDANMKAEKTSSTLIKE